MFFKKKVNKERAKISVHSIGDLSLDLWFEFLEIAPHERYFKVDSLEENCVFFTLFYYTEFALLKKIPFSEIAFVSNVVIETYAKTTNIEDDSETIFRRYQQAYSKLSSVKTIAEQIELFLLHITNEKEQINTEKTTVFSEMCLSFHEKLFWRIFVGN